MTIGGFAIAVVVVAAAAGDSSVVAGDEPSVVTRSVSVAKVLPLESTSTC